MIKHFSNIKCDDTLQCFYYSTNYLTNVQWEELCDAINKTITSFCNEYIWHRDELKVFLPLETTGARDENLPHLMSVTCFGDNIEDEWFIVHILFGITKIYPDLIIQLEDSDGDFLLIEAAEHLPTWCNPDNTPNRVFIYHQNIHIIPPDIAPLDTILELSDALKYVKDKPLETKASMEIQEAVLKRVYIVSENKHDNSFTAVVNIPLQVAAVLTLKPSLISSLVTTYCSVDALEVKHYKEVQFDNCISAEIKFTKYLYAMLHYTKLPNIQKLKHLENDKKNKLGFKLTCGYNTIMRYSKDVYSSVEYQKFLSSLNENGYFKGNLQGSKEYNHLLEKAKEYFDQMSCPINNYVCNQINNLKFLKEFGEIKQVLQQRSDSGILENIEIDDEWLNVQSDGLDDLLNVRFGYKSKLKPDEPLTSDIISSKLNKFLKETSDFEGIEQTRDNMEEDNNVEFDSEEFVNSLEKMLNIISNDNEPELEMDDFSDDECTENNSNNTFQDLELASKLKTAHDNDVLNNFVQSMKEEGSSGPTSTVLKTIGVEKSDLLDSDDDDEEYISA